MSKELTLEDWLARSRGSAYKGNVMRLIAAPQRTQKRATTSRRELHGQQVDSMSLTRV